MRNTCDLEYEDGWVKTCQMIVSWHNGIKSESLYWKKLLCSKDGKTTESIPIVDTGTFGV